jgi:hypothetical protein
MGSPVDFIPAALGLIGSGEQADAAQAQAQGQADAARIAAEAAAFRPVGLTTRFGKSGYTYDANGNIVGAGYQVAPDVAAMREGMMGLAGGSLSQVQQMRQLQPYLDESGTNLFKLGTSVLPQTMDLGQASQQYMQQQQGLLAPGREQQLAKVRNSLQQSGRAGLALGATEAGRLAATNPEMAAYYNSLAQQDAQLAANADVQARANRQSDINTGIGLMGSGINTVSQGYGLQTAALAPWNAYMQGAQGLESMGAGAMDMSSALGAKVSTAGANQAQYLNRTNTNTGYSGLGTGLMALANNPTFAKGLSGLFNPYPNAVDPMSRYTSGSLGSGD